MKLNAQIEGAKLLVSQLQDALATAEDHLRELQALQDSDPEVEDHDPTPVHPWGDWGHYVGD